MPRARFAVTLAPSPQPDQQPGLWDRHVAVYEEAFEPLTSAFAARALDALALPPGARLLDVGAGTGGAALMAAARGLEVTAVDASRAMVERMRERARSAGLRLSAEAMDGTALDLPDGAFDGAISVFGVVLFPDMAAGMREMARVLKPGGRAAVVTWTDIHRYELASRLSAAIAAVRPPDEAPPPGALPAQLRYREEPVFRAALEVPGLAVREVFVMEERWTLPSARWIGDRLAFAPGLAAQLAGLGERRQAVVESFVGALERDRGPGPVELLAVAHAGLVTRNTDSHRNMSEVAPSP